MTTPFRAAVVTGASSDIGEACARRLPREAVPAGHPGLVNNAGGAITGPLEYLPVAQLRNQLEVNVVGQSRRPGRGGPRRGPAPGKRGLAPEEVADVVVHALTTKWPRTRYLVGRDAKLRARAAGVLPDRVFDRLIARPLSH